MTEFIIANISYVALRLFVTGNIVLGLRMIFCRWMPESWSWYAAVAVMAQLSFWYDYFLFKWTLFSPA